MCNDTLSPIFIIRQCSFVPHLLFYHLYLCRKFIPHVFLCTNYICAMSVPQVYLDQLHVCHKCPTGVFQPITYVP